MKPIKLFLDSECSTKRNTCPNKPEWVLYFTVQCALIERYIHLTILQVVLIGI